MSFLHNHSCECVNSELDLFALPATQTSVENGQWIHYKPLTALSNESPIEFMVPGTGDSYMDLSQTMLNLTVRIKKNEDSNLTDIDNVAPVNNWMSSLFSQLDIYLNQKMISPPNNTYGYRAYLETLLNYGADAKESYLTSSFWYPDTAPNVSITGEGNEGYKRRKQLTSLSKTVDLMGRLHSDIFNQEKFMLNGVEMRAKLVRSRDSFSLMGSGEFSYKIEILDATLLIRKAKISPTILLAHAKTLELTSAKYALTRTDIKVITIPAGTQGKTLDNIFLGQLPKRCIIGFVENKSFNGNFNSNPFNFHHQNLNFLALYVDNDQIPSKPLQPDFTAKNYMYAYNTLFSGTGINFLNEGNKISREQYPYGYCLYAFDLTPNLSASNTTFWNLIRHGSLRMEVKFAESLTETLNCIIYAEFDNVIEIDKNRNVVVDFGS